MLSFLFTIYGNGYVLVDMIHTSKKRKALEPKKNVYTLNSTQCRNMKSSVLFATPLSITAQRRLLDEPMY